MTPSASPPDLKALDARANLIRRLEIWPATEGRGDALDSGFVRALMREAATALSPSPEAVGAVEGDRGASSRSADLIEECGKAIYDRQRGRLPDQESVNAQRPWRSDDVPAIFWDGFCLDAAAVLGVNSPPPTNTHRAETQGSVADESAVTVGERPALPGDVVEVLRRKLEILIAAERAEEGKLGGNWLALDMAGLHRDQSAEEFKEAAGEAVRALLLAKYGATPSGGEG